MSTLNVGAMAARLGLDPSEFLEKMKGVEGFASASGQRIANEMKRTSREGAESLRLIDEALGVHLSRPVTRIISQEFPALAQGLSSILGAGVLGAVGLGLFEFGEKAAAAMEKAQKAQEAYRQSTEKLKTTFDQVMAGYAKMEAERGLSGADKKISSIDSEALEKGTHQLDELSKAAEDNAHKALEASSLTTRALAAIGKFLHTTFTRESLLQVEATNKQFEEFRKKLDEIASANAANPARGLQEQLKAIQAAATEATAALEALKKAQLDATNTTQFSAVTGFEAMGPGAESPSDQQVAAQQKFVDSLKDQETVMKKLVELNKADDLTAQIEAHNQALAEQHSALQSLFDDIQSSSAKLTPDANPFTKIAAEWEAARMKADNDFQAFKDAALKGTDLGPAQRAFDKFIEDVKKKIAEARKNGEDWAAEQQALNAALSIAPGAKFSPSTATAAQGTLSMAPVRADLAELAEVQKNGDEAYKKAGEVIEATESPLQKYQTQLQILTTLQDNGRISLDQYNAAVAQLSDKLTTAELHVEEMRKKLEKLLQQSTSATAGVKAFMLSLQIEGSKNGKVAFDLLNQGLRGFEDETVRVLEGGKANWRKYFEDLAAMALKAMETKAISSALSGLIPSDNPKNAGSISQMVTAGAGPIPLFSKEAQAGVSGSEMATAGATLNTAGTQLIAAATALTSAAASMGASGSGWRSRRWHSGFPRFLRGHVCRRRRRHARPGLHRGRGWPGTDSRGQRRRQRHSELQARRERDLQPFRQHGDD